MKFFNIKSIGFPNFLKPKNILTRLVIFLAICLIVFQTIVGIAFYNNHWIRTEDTLIRNLYLDFSVILSNQNSLSNMQSISQQLDLPTQKINSIPSSVNKLQSEKYILDIEKYFSRSLNLPVKIDAQSLKPHLLIYFTLKDGTVIRSYVSNRRFSVISPYPFFISITAVSFIFLLIVFQVFRLQFRPLIKLAKMANNLGKGIEVPDLEQTGAQELKLLAKSFNIMKNRIKRNMQQRVLALAAISHDLRTPLTRMRLQLSLIPQTEEVTSLINDVDEMKMMLDEYLAYVRDESQMEISTEVDSYQYLKSFLKRVYPDNKNIVIKDLDYTSKIIIKPFAFSRCLTNIINNAIAVASNVEITIDTKKDSVNIYIDDNGPGIPLQKREDVFRPFYKIDPARNLNIKGGVGLGLSIAQDIIHAHGGNISIEDSPLNGTRIHIQLPV